MSPNAPFKFSPVFFGAEAAPLFEEEGDVGGLALVADVGDPGLFDGAVAGAAFAADDDPVHGGKIHLANRADQRFERQKAHRGVGVVQVFDAGFFAAVFDRDAQPNVGGRGGVFIAFVHVCFEPR